jgi:hypothetical protein
LIFCALCGKTKKQFFLNLKSNSMNRIITAGFIACTVLATFTGCKKDKGGNASGTITITTAINGDQNLYLAGSGKATIDWGEPGSTKTTVTLNALPANPWNMKNDNWKTTFKYPDLSTKTITITGNITGIGTGESRAATGIDVSNMKALKFLSCSNEKLAALNVSKNTALTYLDCYYNQLTSLDVSKNTALTDLYCFFNIINTENLISLLGGLPNRKGKTSGQICIDANPGVGGSGYPAAQTAAEGKNWVFQWL